MSVLRVKNAAGIKDHWDASPQAISAAAEWFYPCLERFVWGAQSTADHYVIEGVDFLPEQAARLAKSYPLRALFLGCSQMTAERFDRYPGRSRGYSGLPEETRRQFAQDIPGWSAFVRQEAQRFACPYLDMSEDFSLRLSEAEALLTI